MIAEKLLKSCHPERSGTSEGLVVLSEVGLRKAQARAVEGPRAPNLDAGLSRNSHEAPSKKKRGPQAALTRFTKTNYCTLALTAVPISSPRKYLPFAARISGMAASGFS